PPPFVTLIGEYIAVVRRRNGLRRRTGNSIPSQTQIVKPPVELFLQNGRSRATMGADRPARADAYGREGSGMVLLIEGGTVHDAVHREPYQADVLVRDGKIERIEKDIHCEDAQVFDAHGLQVYPGFVEAHGHSGLDGYGIGYEGQDYNEMGDILSPQLRAI